MTAKTYTYVTLVDALATLNETDLNITALAGASASNTSVVAVQKSGVQFP